MILCLTQLGLERVMDYSRIQKNDSESLSELFKLVFNSEPWNDNWTSESSKNRIDLQLANINSVGFKAVHNDKMLGFILGYLTGLPDGIGFFIEDLCVHPEDHNKGIGKGLMGELENFLTRKDIRLALTTTAKGFDSYHFYINNGFIDNKTTVGLFKILK